jgi:hypothetical protein
MLIEKFLTDTHCGMRGIRPERTSPRILLEDTKIPNTKICRIDEKKQIFEILKMPFHFLRSRTTVFLKRPGCVNVATEDVPTSFRCLIVIASVCLNVLMSYITEKLRSHPFELNKTYLNAISSKTRRMRLFIASRICLRWDGAQSSCRIFPAMAKCIEIQNFPNPKIIFYSCTYIGTLKKST